MHLTRCLPHPPGMWCEILHPTRLAIRMQKSKLKMQNCGGPTGECLNRCLDCARHDKEAQGRKWSSYWPLQYWNTSSMGTSNILAILKASVSEGEYLSASMAIMVCRVTPAASANCCWVIRPFSKRNRLTWLRKFLFAILST